MRYLILLSVLFTVYAAKAQDEQPWKEPSKESQAYHDYRNQLSVPIYSSVNVKNAIKKYVKPDGDDNRVMKESIYNKFTPKEKFVYAMIHPEAYSQICDANPPIEDEHKKIFGYLPDAFADYALSERQEKFLNDNRELVSGYFKECISKNNRIGVNYKQAIININAVSLIPFLIETYNKQKKDHDILTMLLLLMKNNNYEEFLKSSGYKKLYGEESNYLSHLELNKANVDLIISRATNFYNGYKK